MKVTLVKLAGTFLTVLLFAFGAAAQSSANCALPQAPRLLGLRLGMTPAEVRSVFGKDLKIKVKSSGERAFFQNYINKKATGKLTGVRALYLRFLEGSLYQIEIFYEERRAAPTLEIFAGDLAADLKLPETLSWKFEKSKAVIDCGAFTLTADKPVDPRVELTDTAKRADAEARRKKKE